MLDKRTNKDFLSDLRVEINASQKRRAQYVLAKLGFTTSLFGVGALSIHSHIPTLPLLYLVPLTAFIFDLYILSEDFGVKRAGIFLRQNKQVPSEERIWEKAVTTNRDPFTPIAGPLSSLLILNVIGVTIFFAERGLLLYLLWPLANVLLGGATWWYISTRKKRLKKFEDSIEAIHKSLPNTAKPSITPDTAT